DAAAEAAEDERLAVDDERELPAAGDDLRVLDERAADLKLLLVGEPGVVDVVAARVVLRVDLVDGTDHDAAVRLLRPVERPRVAVGDAVLHLGLGVGERLVAAVAVTDVLAALLLESGVGLGLLLCGGGGSSA